MTSSRYLRMCFCRFSQYKSSIDVGVVLHLASHFNNKVELISGICFLKSIFKDNGVVCKHLHLFK